MSQPAVRTSVLEDSIIIQRSYLDPSDTSDYTVAMLSANPVADKGFIILSLSRWLVLKGKKFDSATEASAQTSISVETAKALIVQLTEAIDSL